MAPATLDYRSPIERAVIANIDAQLKRRRISGRDLCRRMDEAHTWWSKRFSGELALTVGDLGKISDATNIPIPELMGLRQGPLKNSEARDVDDLLEDDAVPRSLKEEFLRMLGTGITLVYAAASRRRPPLIKEPKMTDAKSRPRRK